MFRPRVYWFNTPANLPSTGWTLSANASDFVVTRSEHGYVFTSGTHATAVADANVKCITGRWEVADAAPEPQPSDPAVVPLKRKK